MVAELIVTIEFLFGASAVYTGSHSNLQRWCFGPYYKKSRDPLNSEPLEPRRQALIRLYDDPPPGLAAAGWTWRHGSPAR
ncbi:hypothetical protein E1293_24885 [Actinomadura darangshiensis]|uniref:Uncharacterized protein n=1 Tax=Actinomadura darangshiensis TaxID=705336 RepID=A0A4R5AWZ4_9ACTN|nr:hypothetical protein [Actinomadura darangshiensis]TDD78018.1 hypothetical protein E1293_24885 [Actinomadura darangshiensis]